MAVWSGFCMPLAELAMTSVLVCDFALGPLGLLRNPSQTVPSCRVELPFQFPAASLQTKKIFFFCQIERGSPMGRQCRENGEVTCLPQGHLAWAQLDSCPDDLLSDAIMGGGLQWGGGDCFGCYLSRIRSWLL